MHSLRVNDVLKDRVLVSRESARLLEDQLTAVLASAMPRREHDALTVTVDFAGVEGIAPSFLDELLKVFESVASSAAIKSECRLIISNPPTRLSLKFEAVARGHQMSLQALGDGSWLLAGNVARSR